jgi:hypothetical protein
MLLRPEYLSQKLDHPLPTKDAGTLHTIRDACDYMTAGQSNRGNHNAAGPVVAGLR